MGDASEHHRMHRWTLALGGVMGLISWIVIGFVVGLIGYVVSGRRHDNRPIIAGLVGGVVGGIVAALFGADVIGFSVAGAIVSLVFAIGALMALRLVTR